MEIRASLIFEVLGRPKEHIIEMLELLIKELGKKKGIIITKNKIHEARQLPKSEGTQDLFSSFAEVEIVAEDTAKILEIIFDYMPSSVEIVEPKELKINLSDANALLNDLATRLHHYNMLINAMRAQLEILSEKLKNQKKD